MFPSDDKAGVQEGPDGTLHPKAFLKPKTGEVVGRLLPTTFNEVVETVGHAGGYEDVPSAPSKDPMSHLTRGFMFVVVVQMV